jgi:hypothetical protein
MAIAERTSGTAAAVEDLERAYDPRRAGDRALAVGGFIAVMALIAYEWIFSGLTKAIRGGFPGGIAGALRDMHRGMPGWYRGFVDGAVVPHARVFGVLIVAGELAVGLTFLAAAVLAATSWRRLGERGRSVALAAVLAASLTGAFMAINFHLAMGANAPWQLPKDGFDESVDLDSLMVAVQVLIAALSARALVARGRGRLALAVVSILLAAGAGGLAAASGGRVDSPRPAAAADSLRRVGPGPLAVTITSGDYSLSLRSQNTVRGDGTVAVRLVRQGRPVSGARVRVMYSMPRMRPGTDMSALSKTLLPAGAGTYTARSPALGMAGDWLIGIAVNVPHAPPLAAALGDRVAG